jgi:hypothetical protein
MNDFRAMLGSFLTLAVALPLAIVIGYLLATGTGGLDYTTLVILGLVTFGLLLPLLLKWHHPLLIFSWNMCTVVFFLPGSPSLWLLMALISFGFMILQRAIDANKKVLSTPSVTLPLLILAMIVVMTGYYRGGLGLHSMGAATVGGKKYWLILGAIIGYLAISGRQVPKEKAWLYVGLFFLGGLTNLVSDAIQITPQSLWFIFWIFPANPGAFAGGSSTVLAEGFGRYYGISIAALAFCFYFMARHGLRGMLEGTQVWRFALFATVGVFSLLGGFRTFFILATLTFLFFYYFEGLVRSKYTPIMLVFSLMILAFVSMFPQQLPGSVQRAISFLPVDIDPAIRADALGSYEWRMKMWRTLMPEIPDYLFVGKGYAMNSAELELMAILVERGGAQSADLSLMAGDYHNGPLSMQIPFGIFGSLTFCWFLIAAGRALYNNWRYGEPDLRHVNGFLLAFFCARVVIFLFVFGGFYSDIAHFAGLIGFGLSLNGGICQPKSVPVATKQAIPLRSRLPLPRAPQIT